MPSLKAAVISILGALEVVAIWSMWIQIHQNGHYAMMVHLRDYGPHLLPGSNLPLKKSYVGIRATDYILTVLQCTFANVVDGSSPGLSLFAFQFGGTVLAAIVLLWTESLKTNNQSFLLRS